MKRKPEVYSYIKKCFSDNDFKSSIDSSISYGVTAGDVEEMVGVVRNNASSLLNELVLDDKLIKIFGRPVHFVPKSEAESALGASLKKSEYTLQELQEIKNSSYNEDPFSKLIGYNGSLKNCINQAKAAIMYPPNGLHTLLLGQSGVGKSFMAQIMHEYVCFKKRKTSDQYPFVVFNCADYCNNPHLLLSQIFGHVKGAYTGADRDKDGLVVRANGGMLFLDEIHRLPPEGQEMLFTLMDRGEYHRMGEPGIARKSDVLIIAATTENPYSVLLQTFLRRIPVMINIPSLSERSIIERIEIIEMLFKIEAIRIKRKLRISNDVIRSMLSSEFRGNIGQVRSLVKQICAQAFLKHIDNTDCIDIEMESLPTQFRNAVTLNDSDFKEIQNIDTNMVITPSNKNDNYKIPKKNIYADIIELNNKLRKRGESESYIKKSIEELVNSYIRNVVNKFDSSIEIKENLYKTLDKKVVDFTYSMVEMASKELDRELNSNILCVLAFHIYYLIMRVRSKEAIDTPEIHGITDSYPEEFRVAGIIIKKIEEEFEIDIAEGEIYFITMLLSNESMVQPKKDNIGIVILAHGKSTATSMAEVSNRIMQADIAIGVDMPLEDDMEYVYKKVLSTVKMADNGFGVLLMVDMGSLINIGKRISEESGIKIRVIDRVSTPYVLEAIRCVLYKDGDLDSIYKAISEYISMPLNGEEANLKKNCIITTCSTGIGTSTMLYRKVKAILEKKGINDIKVIQLPFMDIKNHTERYEDILEKYSIIACVGNINPEIDTVYFDLQDFINNSGVFEKFVDAHSSINTLEEVKNDIFNEVELLLNDTVIFLNVSLFIKVVRLYFNKLSENGIILSDDTLIKCAIHMAYMIERLAFNELVKFDNKEEYIKVNSDIFDVAKKNMDIVEREFGITVTDDEICYLCEVLKALSLEYRGKKY